MSTTNNQVMLYTMTTTPKDYFNYLKVILLSNHDNNEMNKQNNSKKSIRDVLVVQKLKLIIPNTCQL